MNKDHSSNMVSGAVSGLLSTISVIAGVSGAHLPSNIILVLAIAVSFTNALGVATANYLSKSKHDSIGSIYIFIFAFIVALSPLSVYIFEYMTNIHVPYKYIYALFSAFTSLAIVAHIKHNESKYNPILIASLTTIISYGIGYYLQGLTNI